MINNNLNILNIDINKDNNINNLDEFQQNDKKDLDKNINDLNIKTNKIFDYIKNKRFNNQREIPNDINTSIILKQKIKINSENDKENNINNPINIKKSIFSKF